MVFNSVRQCLNNNLRFCYELYGLDFMIDECFRVLLIEVNTNPSLEESGGLLKTLLPPMISKYPPDYARLPAQDSPG